MFLEMFQISILEQYLNDHGTLSNGCLKWHPVHYITWYALKTLYKNLNLNLHRQLSELVWDTWTSLCYFAHDQQLKICFED